MKRKLKIVTKYNKKDKIEKLIFCLKNHPEGANPKTIAHETQIKYSTVRNLLRENIPEISKKELRGIYYYVGSDRDRVFEWTLQNAFISCKLNLNLKEGIQLSFGDEDLVKFDFMIGSSSNKATLHLSAKYPVNISSLSVYCSLFKLLIGKYTEQEIKDEEIWISTVEFQRDFKSLRMDGTNSIILTNLISQFKTYNKKQGLRKEYKITNSINAEAILNLLTSEINNIDAYDKIYSIDKRIGKIENSFRRFNILFNDYLSRKR